MILLLVVAALIVVYFKLSVLCHIFHSIYVFYIASWIYRTKDLKKFGGWVVITGATDGIGKGYAFALAAKGLNIVLFGRNEEKLAQVEEELKSVHPNIKTKCFFHDFSRQSTAADVQRIAATLESVDVGILVNNVGIAGQNYGKHFLDMLPSPYEAAFLTNHVNCDSVLLMTSLVLKGMVEKKRGAIINISSLTSICPTASRTVYSGTKVFVDHFTRSLQEELRDTGVYVQSVRPGIVQTNLFPSCYLDKTSRFVSLDGMSYAKFAVNSIGLQEDTYGCLSHTFQGVILTAVSTLLPNAMFGKVLSFFLASKK